MNVKHALATAVAVVALAACSGASTSSGGGGAQPPAVAGVPSATSNAAGPSPTTADAAPTAANPTPTSAGAAPTVANPSPTAAAAQATNKVDANKASIAELQSAFQAAGIANAARWAREVDEYRPYPTDDPGFAKLRRELAKYNPGAETVDKIVATLAI